MRRFAQLSIAAICVAAVVAGVRAVPDQVQPVDAAATLLRPPVWQYVYIQQHSSFTPALQILSGRNHVHMAIVSQSNAHLLKGPVDSTANRIAWISASTNDSLSLPLDIVTEDGLWIVGDVVQATITYQPLP